LQCKDLFRSSDQTSLNLNLLYITQRKNLDKYISLLTNYTNDNGLLELLYHLAVTLDHSKSDFVTLFKALASNPHTLQVRMLYIKLFLEKSRFLDCTIFLRSCVLFFFYRIVIYLRCLVTIFSR